MQKTFPGVACLFGHLVSGSDCATSMFQVADEMRLTFSEGAQLHFAAMSDAVLMSISELYH